MDAKQSFVVTASGQLREQGFTIAAAHQPRHRIIGMGFLEGIDADLGNVDAAERRNERWNS